MMITTVDDAIRKLPKPSFLGERREIAIPFDDMEGAIGAIARLMPREIITVQSMPDDDVATGRYCWRHENSRPYNPPDFQ